MVHTSLSTRMEFSPVNAACPSKTVTPDFSRFLFSYDQMTCFLELSINETGGYGGIIYKTHTRVRTYLK